MQTLHAGCSKAEPKILAPQQTPSQGRRTTKNLISWITYKPSLVRIDVHNFELLW